MRSHISTIVHVLEKCNIQCLYNRGPKFGTWNLRLPSLWLFPLKKSGVPNFKSQIWDLYCRHWISNTLVFTINRPCQTVTILKHELYPGQVALICVHVLQIALIGGSVETCPTYTCCFSYLDIVFLFGCCFVAFWIHLKNFMHVKWA